MFKYTILLLMPFLAGCGMFSEKEEIRESSRVSAHDRDLAECEMKALEVIPQGEDAAARIQRYTRLCMQSRGYPGGGGETDIRVKLRD